MLSGLRNKKTRSGDTVFPHMLQIKQFFFSSETVWELLVDRREFIVVKVVLNNSQSWMGGFFFYLQALNSSIWIVVQKSFIIFNTFCALLIYIHCSKLIQKHKWKKHSVKEYRTHNGRYCETIDLPTFAESKLLRGFFVAASYQDDGD